MNEVVGSKQYRSIVVEDRPVRRRLIQGGVAATFVVAVLAAYWLGGYSGHGGYDALSAAHDEALLQLERIESSNKELSQQLVNIKLSAEVDRTAVDEVRSAVSKHKQTINKLNEEISFYKGLMSPTDRERGLGIRSWEVYPTNDPRRFQFKLVVQQLAVKHAVLKGTVTVQLVGWQGGEEQTFSLDILSEQVERSATKLRFKYFQYIDGELHLPEGFAVERVDIVARATAPKKVQVEKHYSWIVHDINV